MTVREAVAAFDTGSALRRSVATTATRPGIREVLLRLGLSEREVAMEMASRSEEELRARAFWVARMAKRNPAGYWRAVREVPTPGYEADDTPAAAYQPWLVANPLPGLSPQALWELVAQHAGADLNDRLLHYREEHRIRGRAESERRARAVQEAPTSALFRGIAARYHLTV